VKCRACWVVLYITTQPQTQPVSVRGLSHVCVSASDTAFVPTILAARFAPCIF